MKTDRELIELANQGDPDAFEALYYRYRDWVFRLAWRFTGDHQDSLDVLQETFIYLLGKFPGFELTASMTTFLYPAIRHISMAIRAKKNQFASDDEVLGELEASKHKEPRGDSRSELAVALTLLPDQQREILLMRFVDVMNL